MSVVTGFRSVTAFVPDGVRMLGVGLVAELFGARGADGTRRFTVAYSTEHPGALATDLGLPLVVEHGLDSLATADLILLLPAESPARTPSAAVTEAILAAYNRGAIIASHDEACFTLAAAGLLDGKRVTTHRRLSVELAARNPLIMVEPDVDYIDEGRLVTGASALDLYLYLIRREHGAATAGAIWRDTEPPARHLGSPSRVAETPELGALELVLDWAVANLHRPIEVKEMAAQAWMSARTFSRQFRALTGTTPHAWLSGQRLARAQELLEDTGLSIEEVARRVGYGSAAGLREQFIKNRGLPPREYRRRFRGRPNSWPQSSPVRPAALGNSG